VKDLLLLRHAKSSWDDPLLEDADRPLNKRGREAARRVARWFQDNSLMPAYVLCSPALRTRQTLDAIRPVLGPDARIELDPSIYLAEASDLFGRIKAVKSATPSVLLIGHNPGLQELALALTPARARRDRQRMAEKFPTAAFAWFRVRARSWSALEPEKMELVAYLRPADLKD
jgi:phosphohistidine phosphatase